MIDVVIRPTDVLDHTIDLQARIDEVPREWEVSGMFFSRLVTAVGPGWRERLTGLERPPRTGRYIPFKAYPQRDYSRFIAAAAERKYRDLPVPEAIRRIARADFDVFAKSTFGKVVLAAVGDARAALHKAPMVYAKVAPGFERFTTADLNDDVVRIDFQPQLGFWEYQVGQWEGIVSHWYPHVEIAARQLEDRLVQYDVKWR